MLSMHGQSTGIIILYRLSLYSELLVCSIKSSTAPSCIKVYTKSSIVDPSCECYAEMKYMLADAHCRSSSCVSRTDYLIPIVPIKYTIQMQTAADSPPPKRIPSKAAPQPALLYPGAAEVNQKPGYEVSCECFSISVFRMICRM